MIRFSHALVSFAAVGVTALIVSAEGMPDFSGKWRPTDPPANTSAPSNVPMGGPPPPPRTLSSTITQSAARLRVDRLIDESGRETVYTFIYALDGSDSVNRMGELVFRTKCAWSGNSLVLRSSVSLDGNQVVGELEETYRLDGEELIVETMRRTPAGTFSGRTAHKKI